MKVNWIKIHDECEAYKKILKPTEENTRNFISTIEKLASGEIDLSGVKSLYGFIESYLRKLIRLNQYESAKILSIFCIDIVNQFNQHGLSPAPKTRWPLALAMLGSLQTNKQYSESIIKLLIGDSIGSKENIKSLLTILITQRSFETALQLLIQSTKQGLNNQHSIILSSPEIKTWYNNFPGVKNKLDEALSDYEIKQAHLETPKNYSEAIEVAYNFLQKPFLPLETDTDEILALIDYRDKIPIEIIEEFFDKSFTLTKNIARRTGELVNTTIYNSLLRLMGYFLMNTKKPSSTLCNILIRECWFLIFDENEKMEDPYNLFFPVIHKNNSRNLDQVSRHYELNTLAGNVALLLANFNRPDACEAIDCFVKSFIENYPGESFVMKGLYAKWIITQDIESPLTFIKHQQNIQELGYAIAVLADLNHKPAIEIIENIRKNTTQVLLSEICKEALVRLQMQSHVPLPQERMIHLFGMLTTTELVLGEKTDNQFLLNAHKLTNNQSLGVIHEVDDSDA